MLNAIGIYQGFFLISLFLVAYSALHVGADAKLTHTADFG